MVDSEKLDLILNEIIGIKDDMKELKIDVSELKVDVSELKIDVSELKADVRELKIDVSELKTDVMVLKTDMKNVKEEMAEHVVYFKEMDELILDEISRVHELMLIETNTLKGKIGGKMKRREILRKQFNKI